tara:strand:- start:19413 stop:20360 length:948 start_codon:yes stop_codon:yes gene_type:complete
MSELNLNYVHYRLSCKHNVKDVLFENSNPKSEYVPFYSILYKEHLNHDFKIRNGLNIENYSDIYNVFDNEKNMKGINIFKSIIGRRIFSSGIVQELRKDKEINKLTIEKFIKENKEELKTNLLQALKLYIYAEPDIRLINFNNNVNKISVYKSILEAYNIQNDTGYKFVHFTNKIETICNTGIVASSDFGVLSCIMVKREDVPLLRYNHLITNEWDKSLLEIWTTKEIIQIFGGINNVYPFVLSSYNNVIVDNFENIFYKNPFKTLSERRAYLKSKEDLFNLKVKEGLEIYNNKIKLESEIVYNNLVEQGFEIVK